MRFIVTLLMLLNLSVQAQKGDSTKVDLLFANQTKGHTPGATVAIVNNGKIIYKKGYGYANLEYDIPNTPSTVFHIASLSKQFTALSILLLAKDGKLSLTDNINKYIPEMPVFEKPITIFHLLNHTSGLREWIYLFGIQGYRLNDMFTQEQIIRVLSDQKELNFAPGSRFMYVNSGYNLLGEIVARVSGMSFAKFVSLRIFTPLKMTHSMVSDNYETIIKNAACSYSPGGEKGYRKKMLNFVNVIGSTGIKTTVEDMCRWANNFNMPEVGDTGIFNFMKQRGVLNNGDSISYAMGQFISSYKGLYTIDHSGSDAGFRSHLLRFPKQGLSIIVLGNDASLDAGSLAYRIADIYLKKEAKRDSSGTDKLTLTTSLNSVSADAQTLISYVGKYELKPALFMDFSVEGNNLTVTATGQGKFILQQISPGVFKINGVNGIITFGKIEQEVIDNIEFEINGNKIQGKRVKAKPITEEVMQEYTGQYYSKELNTTYSIVFDNGKLVVKNNRSGDTDLSPINKDDFSGSQWFMGIVKFKRNDKQIITGFTISSDRVDNLDFEKNQH